MLKTRRQQTTESLLRRPLCPAIVAGRAGGVPSRRAGRLGLMIVFLSAGGPAALAQFGAPVSAPAAVNSNATTDTLDDKSPRLATDGCNWVAVWESDENFGGAGIDKDIFVARSTDNGATWTAVALLNTNATTDGAADDDKKPWIETDGSGNWVAVWESTTNLSSAGIDSDIFVSRSTDNGATWTAPALLNSNATTDGVNDDDKKVVLETDDSGNWVAVWESTTNLGGSGVDSDLFVSRSTDNGLTWTTVALLNSNATTDTLDDKEPSLVTNNSGNWVIVWKSDENFGGAGTDDDVFVSRSTDNGLTWTAVALLNSNATTDTGDDKKPIVETDGSGNWVVVWESKENLSGAGGDADIFVSRSTDNGATWTAVALLNSTAATDGAADDDKEPSIETDRSGNWVVVWKSNDDLSGAGVDDDIFAARSTDAGATWTTVDILNTNATTDSGDDKKPFVLSNGSRSWLVVWESKDTLGSTIGIDSDVLRATFVLPGCWYVDSFQAWSATAANSWQTKDLSGCPFNVPSSAVVEIAVRNADAVNALSGGVRAVGSSLERRLTLHAAEAGGVDVLVMHVQTDSGSQIQHYSGDTAQVDFVLLGYWPCGTYAEKFDTFTAGASASWQDKNLCSLGLGPQHVAEIVMTNDDPLLEREAGVRTNGSALARRLNIHKAEGGGIDAATLFVKTEATGAANVELYAQDDADIDFYLVGYWSVAPRAYTELFADAGNPATDATWEDVDLTAAGVPDSAVAEMALSNDFALDEDSMGVRSNGSSLGRTIQLHEAEDGGGDFYRTHVLTDSTATIEFYHQDVSDTHTFRVVGYWDTCDTSISYSVIDLGAVTAANSSLGWHMNSSRKVAGFEEDASGDPDAWSLACGTFTTLGVLGGSDAEAQGINDNDMVVGWSDDGSGNRRAYTWTSGGGLTDLGTVAGRTDSEALSVNASSEVVGTVLDFDAVVADKDRLAFLYLPSPAYTLSAGMNSLGTLGGSESVAMDINDSGQVVGGSQNAAGNFRPFRWANGTMTDLGTLGGERFLVDHRAEAINSSGNVCGRSYTSARAKHAFYYNGSMSDLGVLTGGAQSWAFGINDSNVVVGTSDTTGSVFRAFVWDSTNGMRNLNNLIPTGTGWTLIRATDINKDGFITGWGTNGSGDTRAFLLTLSCNASGGGAAALASVLGSGTGVTDSNGAFHGRVTDSDGEPLAEVDLLNPETGIRVSFEVFDPATVSGEASSVGSPARQGFDDDISLTRTLSVATTAIQPGSFVTVSMTFTRDEIAALGMDPADLQLHVLDDSANESTGVWIPAGKSIGESAPTMALGDSGFAAFPDGSVDYWAVRDAGGTFAVGKPTAQIQAPESPGPGPRLCGVAMIPPLLLCSMLLGFRRWSGARTRILPS